MPATSALSTTIRLFISSTFLDLQRERAVLQRRVFPMLRQQCAEAGFRFQPIDLRWGVSEAAAAEHQASRICLEELARCQERSPDLSLLILLGDRYGSCFLPTEIPADQAIRLRPYLDSHAMTAFESAYVLDENAVPPAYTLRRKDELTSGSEGDLDEGLRESLARAVRLAGFSEMEQLPFSGAVTHQEIAQGLLAAGADATGVLAIFRTFTRGPSGAMARNYIELDQTRAAQLTHLKQVVAKHLPAEQQMSFSAPWSTAGSPLEDEAQDTTLAASFLAFLQPHLQRVLAARTAARQNRNLLALANAQFAAQRADHVAGREGELARIAAYLAGTDPLPLIVTGAPGSGKSTLLAEAAKRVRAATPEAEIVERYIGITPGTSSLIALLTSLRREIAMRGGQPEPRPASELSELAATLAEQLSSLQFSAERPLILLVDALDQLSSEPQRVDWLPRQLAPQVRVVVSVLPERRELATLRAWVPEARILTIGPLDRAAGRQVLRHWLLEERRLPTDGGRTLTPEQEEMVLDAFEAAEGSPLYLRVAAQEARRWRSFEAPQQRPPLPRTTVGLLDAFLDRMEQPAQFGETLVRHALGDLAAARDGLAEDELLDVLANDAEVRAHLQSLNPYAPPIDPDLPLPASLWVRPAAEMERLLTEREADGAELLTFYHGQVRRVVEARAIGEEEARARHQDLATYFARQPWNLTDARWNLRKLAELPTQQRALQQGTGTGAADAARLRETLTDGRYLLGKLSVAGVPALLEELSWLSNDDDIQTLSAALWAGAVVLSQAPEDLENQVRGRGGDPALLHDLPARILPYFRLRTDSLPRADPALQRIFTGHTDGVQGCALSPDGQLALSASFDRTLRLWEVATGETLLTLTGHTGEVYGCAFSPDGRSALSASEDRTLRLWDVATGICLRTYAGHTDSVWSCAFSPDGKLALSASADHTLRLWEVDSGRAVREFAGHTDKVYDCPFSPDGRLALSASADHTLRLWEVATGECLRTFTGHTDLIRGCAFSPDGRLALSASRDQTLRLWEVARGETLRVFTGHMDGVKKCVFSPDGTRALSASDDLTLRLWEVATGETLRIFTGHFDGVYGCALSRDGSLALSASNDMTVRLWDMKSEQANHTFTGHLHWVLGCAFTPDGARAISASADHTLRLWEVATGRPLRTFSGHTDRIWGCALSADGRFALSASADKTLRLWEVESGECLRTYTGHTDLVYGCAFSPDGRLALSSSWDRTLRLWEIATGQVIRTFTGHTDKVNGCALSPDGRLALSASEDHTLRLWDVQRGREVRVFAGHANGVRGNGVRGCAFSPDGRLALSASEDATLRLWEVASGETLRVFTGHTDLVRSCTFSPNGRLALSTSFDQTLRLWEVASGRQIAQWLDAPLNCCAFTPDGRIVMTGDGSGGVHFLDLVGISTGPAREAPMRDDSPVPIVPAPSNVSEAQAPKRRGWPLFRRR